MNICLYIFLYRKMTAFFMHQNGAWIRTETVTASVLEWSLAALQVASAFLSSVAAADNCAPSNGPGDVNRAEFGR